MTADVVSALCAGLLIGGGIIRWVDYRQTRRRAAIPNVRTEWSTGTAGHYVTVTIANRMTEDLHVYRVEAKTRFVKNIRTYDDGGSIIDTKMTPTAKQQSLDWKIEAGSSGYMTFNLEGANSPRWMRFTSATSAGTFRRLKFVTERP